MLLFNEYDLRMAQLTRIDEGERMLNQSILY